MVSFKEYLGTAGLIQFREWASRAYLELVAMLEIDLADSYLDFTREDRLRYLVDYWERGIEGFDPQLVKLEYLFPEYLFPEVFFETTSRFKAYSSWPQLVFVFHGTISATADDTWGLAWQVSIARTSSEPILKHLRSNYQDREGLLVAVTAGRETTLAVMQGPFFYHIPERDLKED